MAPMAVPSKKEIGFDHLELCYHFEPYSSARLWRRQEIRNPKINSSSGKPNCQGIQSEKLTHLFSAW